jgi:Spy/CpxP family protein refolding chaperone
MQPRIKRIVRWTAIATVTGAVAVWGIANAVDGPHGPHGFGMPGFGPMGPMRELMADLDLTGDQKSQLRTIARSGWEQSADERGQLDAIRKQIEASVKANGFNEAEVRALVNTGTPIMAELMVDMVRSLTEMRAVLTPEQQALFDERRARFESKRGEWRAKHAERLTGAVPAPAGT